MSTQSTEQTQPKPSPEKDAEQTSRIGQAHEQVTPRGMVARIGANLLHGTDKTARYLALRPRRRDTAVHG